jgi:hypothetical protein
MNLFHAPSDIAHSNRCGHSSLKRGTKIDEWHREISHEKGALSMQLIRGRQGTITIAVAFLFAGLSACAPEPPPVDSVSTITQAINAPGGTDAYEVVDCLLPGQIRQLGTQVTYVTERRPVRTTKEDCAIRGGEYVAGEQLHERQRLAAEEARNSLEIAQRYQTAEAQLQQLRDKPDQSGALAKSEETVRKLQQDMAQAKRDADDCAKEVAQLQQKIASLEADAEKQAKALQGRHLGGVDGSARPDPRERRLGRIVPPEQP